MGFMDKIKDIISVPEEDYYEGEEDFAPYQDAQDYAAEDRYSEDRYAAFERPARSAAAPAPERSKDKSNKVVNIHTTTQLQVVLVKPEKLDEVTDVADHLNAKRTVVLNLETTNREVARRLVDFLQGVAYANGGIMKRVAASTFIIIPHNVNIVGDLIDELENNGVFF